MGSLQDNLANKSAAMAEAREKAGLGLGPSHDYEATGQCRKCGIHINASSSLPCTESLLQSAAVVLTNERKKTHGDWMHQSGTANEMRQKMHRSGNWNHLAAHQQEALDMIITKISRIVCGNPDEPDHWDDIAGYAHLGKAGHTK